MATEIRHVGALEFRRDLRQVSGVIMPYGELAVFRNDTRREMFLPGSLVAAADPYLNVMHKDSEGNPAPAILRQSSGLLLTDSDEQLTMQAVLPETREAEDAIKMIADGLLRGLSIEFRAMDEEQRGNVRIVRQALLEGVGLVDSPAYPGATVEVRNSGRRKLWL